jgi:hypothetical protein
MRGRQSQHFRCHLERGFLGLVAIGNEPGYHIDQKVRGTAMTAVFNLRDVLEVIGDLFR